MNDLTDPMEIAERLIRKKERADSGAAPTTRLGVTFYQQFYPALDRANNRGVKIKDFVNALADSGQIAEDKRNAAYQHFLRRYEKMREEAIEQQRGVKA